MNRFWNPLVARADALLAGRAAARRRSRQAQHQREPVRPFAARAGGDPRRGDRRAAALSRLRGDRVCAQTLAAYHGLTPGAGVCRQRLGRSARLRLRRAAEARPAAAASRRHLQLLSRLLPAVRRPLRDGPARRSDADRRRRLSPPGRGDHPVQSQRADRRRAAARRDRAPGRRAPRQAGGDRRGLCRFRRRDRGSADRGASEPARRADDVEIARAGRPARRLRARRRGTDRGRCGG